MNENYQGLYEQVLARVEECRPPQHKLTAEQIATLVAESILLNPEYVPEDANPNGQVPAEHIDMLLANALNDAAFIVELLNGDEKAWSDFWTKVYRLVHNRIQKVNPMYTYTDSYSETLETVVDYLTEQFIVVIQSYDYINTMIHWLNVHIMKISSNVMRNRQFQFDRRVICFALLSGDDDANTSVLEQIQDPSSMITDKTFRYETLRDALNKLSYNEKWTLIYTHLDYSVDEIATQLQITNNNVYQIRHRGLRKMRGQISQDWMTYER